MSANYCFQCGVQLQAGSKFCQNCGQSVDLAKTQTSPILPAQGTQSTTQKKPVGALVGIVLTVIGLIFATACPVIQKRAYEERIVSARDHLGRRLPESTARELSRSLAEHDKPGSGATVFAFFAFLLGIPAIIFFSRHYSRSRSGVGKTEKRKKPMWPFIFGAVVLWVLLKYPLDVNGLICAIPVGFPLLIFIAIRYSPSCS